MTRFLDGPAGGTTLYLGRAPIYLRVTVCGEIVDALDQPGDRPEPSEGLYAYRLVGDVGSVHVQRMPRSKSGWYTTAAYRLIDPQPADDVMRDTERWQEWAEAQHAAAKTAEATR